MKRILNIKDWKEINDKKHHFVEITLNRGTNEIISILRINDGKMFHTKQILESPILPDCIITLLAFSHDKIHTIAKLTDKKTNTKKFQ